MAYKDEYEVARLYTDTGFLARLQERYEGPYELGFHLAPPLFAKRDAATGVPQKKRFGPWILFVFRLFARLRRLRGTPFDVFGYTKERRTERELVKDFIALMRNEVLPLLWSGNHAQAVALAELPQSVKGFGHVKERNLATAQARQAELLAQYRAPVTAKHAATPITEEVR